MFIPDQNFSIPDPGTKKSGSRIRILIKKFKYFSVLRIRIRIYRIHIFLGHPDPLVRGMDPDPDPDPPIIMQK
jgi:hypothetical protein